MKILVISDSFKGSLSSKEIGNIIKSELAEHIVDVIPLSDGGEGFLDAVSSFVELEMISVNTYDAVLRQIEVKYAVCKNRAFIELAKICGLSMLEEEKKNPLYTSTYGVGVVIKDAIERGYKDIYIGIGGSSTNDLGIGLLTALGLFTNNKALNNNDLKDIVSINNLVLNKLLKGIKITVLSDVSNPLLGEHGATYTFGLQKGAKDLETLENNIKNFISLINDNNYINKSGSGASGGVGYGLMKFANAKVYKGVDFILDNINYKDLQNDYDLIITGEGKIDEQTLYGKTVKGIIKQTIDQDKIVVICGVNELEQKLGVKTYSIVPSICSLEASLKAPEINLRKLIQSIKL